MTKAFIGVGSNISPSKNVLAALRALSKAVALRGVSTVYSTDAENRPEQPRYYNCVAAVETDLPPLELRRLVLRRIEEALGRTRGGDRYAARSIDLDILLYDDLTMKNDDLMLPDPHLFDRPYCAIPMAELAPGLVMPGSNSTIDEIGEHFSTQGMRTLTKYTHEIRKKLGLRVARGKRPNRGPLS
jgi:2-amino-4-hydroxy-6-hydroxymethyldihydropteridine diphosphokinase